MAAGQRLERLEFILALQDRVSRRLGAVQQRVQRFTEGVQRNTERLRSAFIGVTAGVLGLVGMAAPALAFEDALARVAVTGGESAAVIEDMRASARALNADFGQGLGDTVRVLEEARRLTGATGDELEAAGRHGLLLSQVFKDLGTRELFAAEAALARDFGLNVQQAGDALAGLAAQGGDLRGELLESILEYSTQFKGLGFDIERTVATTQAALDRGWSIDKMLDAVKEGGIKLRELGAEQVQALGDLGLEGLVPQIRAGEVAIADVMGEVGQRLDRVENDTARFNILQRIFGTPSEDVGVDGMLAMLRAISDSPEIGGALDELNERFMQSPLQQLRRLRGQAENLAVTFGSILLPHLQDVVEWLGRGIDHLQEWAERFPNLTKLAVFAAVGVFGLVIAFGALQAILGIGGILVSGLKLVVGLFALLLSPLGLVLLFIGLLAAAVGLAIAKWDLLKESLIPTAEAIKNAWQVSVEAIDNAMTRLHETVVGWIDAAWEKLKAFGRWIGEGFMELIQPLLDLGGFLGNLLGFGGEGGAEGASLAQRGTRGETAGREVRRAISNVANQDNSRRVQIDRLTIENKERVEPGFLTRALIGESLG